LKFGKQRAEMKRGMGKVEIWKAESRNEEGDG